MQNKWIPLQPLLNQGTDLTLDDQAIWLEPIEEFGLDWKIVSPLKAVLQFLPQEDGLLVRGRINGTVSMPCNLCAEDAKFEIAHSFDSFEPFLSEDEKNDDEVDEYFMRRSPQGGWLEVNPAALVWEEFSQALPVYPLCHENCAGLCEKCGQNLNQGKCGCNKENYDPRLAILHGLKIDK